jgi:hypothetical protein
MPHDTDLHFCLPISEVSYSNLGLESGYMRFLFLLLVSFVRMFGSSVIVPSPQCLYGYTVRRVFAVTYSGLFLLAIVRYIQLFLTFTFFCFCVLVTRHWSVFTEWHISLCASIVYHACYI